MSLHIKTGDGQVTYPFGRDAVGYYLFAENGYMSAAIMGAHRPKFGAGDVLGGTTEEKVAAAETYISYCGKYEIQADKLVVHVEVSFFPNWIGVDQVRLFELTDNNNTLTLSTPPLLTEVYSRLPIWFGNASEEEAFLGVHTHTRYYERRFKLWRKVTTTGLLFSSFFLLHVQASPR